MKRSRKKTFLDELFKFFYRDKFDLVFDRSGVIHLFQIGELPAKKNTPIETNIGK